MRFGYDELVQRPSVVIDDLRAFLGLHGSEVA